MKDEVLKSVIFSELGAIKRAAVNLQATSLTKDQAANVAEIIHCADFISKEIRGEK